MTNRIGIYPESNCITEDYELWLTTAVDRHKAGRNRKKNGFHRETLQKLVGQQVCRKRNLFYSAFSVLSALVFIISSFFAFILLSFWQFLEINTWLIEFF